MNDDLIYALTTEIGVTTLPMPAVETPINLLGAAVATGIL